VLLGLVSRASVAGVREFEQPVLTHPTGLAAAPDGTIWIASTYADKLVRFDPETRKISEVQLPLRSHPAGLLVDEQGIVWFVASGLGLVGRLTEGTRAPAEFPLPSVVAAKYAIPSPCALTLDSSRRELWVTIESAGAVGRLDRSAQPVRRGFAIRELSLGEATSRPCGIAADRHGAIWVAETGADRLTRIDPPSGELRRLPLPAGSRPRGLAASTDGRIWAALFGGHQLLAVDTASFATRAWALPSGARAAPAAIAIGPDGAVWVSDVEANSLVRFQPGTGEFRSYPLPIPNSRVHAIAVDPRGRLWYVGSASGRLGVIE
jgi:virginiamycin B lyase